MLELLNHPVLESMWCRLVMPLRILYERVFAQEKANFNTEILEVDIDIERWGPVLMLIAILGGEKDERK